VHSNDPSYHAEITLVSGLGFRGRLIGHFCVADAARVEARRDLATATSHLREMGSLGLFRVALIATPDEVPGAYRDISKGSFDPDHRGRWIGTPEGNRA
jgi:hypothetical protein